MEDGRAQESTRVAIAVDPVALITTECITVTSAMRKHARWAHSSVSAILGGGATVSGGREVRPSRQPATNLSPRSKSQRPTQVPNGVNGHDDSLASRWGLRGKKGKSMQDNPLMSAFARLRNDLRGCTGQYSIAQYEHQGPSLMDCRYQDLRYPFPSPSFSTSHSLVLDFCTYHISCSNLHHEVLRL